MLKHILQLFLYLFMVFYVFAIISGFEFTAKPFSLKLYDWKQAVLLLGIITLFYTACYISEKKGEKKVWKEIENTVMEISKKKESDETVLQQKAH